MKSDTTKPAPKDFYNAKPITWWAMSDLKRAGDFYVFSEANGLKEQQQEQCEPPPEPSIYSPEKLPDVEWDDIGGLEQAKNDMREAIEWPFTHKKIYEKYNKKPIKGILLSGPPGCGKTMLGKAAANAIAKLHGQESTRTGFQYIKGPEILNKYVGATEENIRDIFESAKEHYDYYKYPAVIFIDEAESILSERGSKYTSVMSTIVPQFLTEMDGLGESSAIVMLATNRPDVLDPAVIRDGRIDRKITITPPGKDAARYILEMNMSGVPLGKVYKKKEFIEELLGIVFSEETTLDDGRPFKDVVNGAMLVTLVDMMVSNAINREIQGRSPKGVCEEDAVFAIKRQIEKNAKHKSHL